MKIAIFGATSYIAKDLLLSFSTNNEHNLKLFVRKPSVMVEWLDSNSIVEHCSVHSYKEFDLDIKADTIINFVGVGDPARAKEMGSSILDVTYQYDDMAIKYVEAHPKCKYVFLSSGAVYNSDFNDPVNNTSIAKIPINDLQSQHWYGIAKMYAECRHRSLPHLSIVDVRIFNYFSSTLDIKSKFLIADIVRSIKSGESLHTSEHDIVRDYICQDDFYQLVLLVLNNDVGNEAFDCYTKQPISKMGLLKEVQKKYGLKYETISDDKVNITGFKLNYYSENHIAENIGYVPDKSSLDNILCEIDKIIN